MRLSLLASLVAVLNGSPVRTALPSNDCVCLSMGTCPDRACELRYKVKDTVRTRSLKPEPATGVVIREEATDCHLCPACLRCPQKPPTVITKTIVRARPVIVDDPPKIYETTRVVTEGAEYKKRRYNLFRRQDRNVGLQSASLASSLGNSNTDRIVDCRICPNCKGCHLDDVYMVRETVAQTDRVDRPKPSPRAFIRTNQTQDQDQAGLGYGAVQYVQDTPLVQRLESHRHLTLAKSERPSSRKRGIECCEVIDEKLLCTVCPDQLANEPELVREIIKYIYVDVPVKPGQRIRGDWTVRRVSRKLAKGQDLKRHVVMRDAELDDSDIRKTGSNVQTVHY